MDNSSDRDQVRQNPGKITFSGSHPLEHILAPFTNNKNSRSKDLSRLIDREFLTRLVLFEQDEKKENDAPTRRTARVDRIQDALLQLLDGQLVVKPKDGQSLEDALKDAKAELAKLLADLRAERQAHRAGAATQAAFRRFQELYSERAVRPARNIAVTFEQACTDDGFERFSNQQRSYTETKRRVNEIQSQLINFIPVYVQPERRDNESDRDYATRVRERQEKTANDLRSEQEQGVWGPQSKEAYKQYQQWYHQECVPNLMGALDSLAAPWPVNCPEQLRMGMARRAEHPELFRALLTQRKRIPQGSSDPERALEDTSYLLFQRNNKWLRDATEACSLALVKPENDKIKQLIISENLPRPWLEGADEDPRRWRASAGYIVNLYIQAGNLLEAMDHVHRASKDEEFPFRPPPGTEFLCKDGKFHTNPKPDDIARNPDGTIKHFKLPKPNNIRLDDRATWETVQALARWVDANQEGVVDAVLAYRGAVANPERLLSFANLEFHDRVARLNAKGELIGMAHPSQPVTEPGETRVPFNLIETRCRVKIAEDGPNKGKEVIEQTVEAYQIPTLGYQNWVGTLVGSVPPKEEVLDKTKFYAVLSGNKIELVRGDKLASVLETQRLWLRGEQILTPMLDALLVAMTFGEGFAALSAARTAGAAARLTTRECLVELAKFGVRVTMVGAGIGNSAGGRDSEFGRFVQHARGIYFLCDIATGLARSTELLPASAASLKLEEALTRNPWLRTLEKQTTRGFRVAEGCMVPFIVRDFTNLRDRGLGTDNNDLLADASLILGDGITLRRPERDTYDMKNPRLLESEREILDRYSTVLQRGTDAAKQRTVKAIIDKTKELLDPNAKAEDREKFKKELLAYFLLEPREMVRIIREFGLTTSDLRELHDPDELMKKWTNNGVADAVAARHADVGKEVRAAAAIALLTLSRKPDGTFPSELVSEMRSCTVGGQASGKGSRSTKYFTVGISFQELIGYLSRDLGGADEHGKDVFIGEVLFRYGGLNGQQYAATLLSRLEDPNSTPESRLAAMSDTHFPRLATLIDGIRLLDEDDIDSARPWRGFGVMAKALEYRLAQTARNDKDEDVRAMATMILLGLSHPDRTAGEGILQHNNARWQALSTKDKGTYAKEVREYLSQQCKVDLPAAAPRGASDTAVKEANQRRDIARAARLNAALRLLDLSDKKNADEQKSIVNIIASCWSDTDAGLSNKVIEALLPDRIALLDRAEAESLRKKAVDLLSVPQLPPNAQVIGLEQVKQAADMVKLIQLIPKLLGDNHPDSTRAFCAKLEQMIDPRTPRDPEAIGDRTYGNLRNQFKPAGTLPCAKLFPELMVEAIRALGAHGSRSSIPFIRARLTGEAPTFDTNNGVRPYQPARGESLNADPLIRREAAKVLALLKDPKLREALPALIGGELEPAVAQILRDIQALPEFAPLKAPDRAQVRQEIFDRARWNLLRPKPPAEGDGFEYLKGNKYKLLGGDAYRSAVRAAHNSEEDAHWATGILGAYGLTQRIVAENRVNKIKKITAERDGQWKQLIEAAKGDNPEAGEAKAAVSWILLHMHGADGNHLSPREDGQSDPDGAEPISGATKLWARRGAEAIVDILINGKDKPKTAYIIEQALENPSVDPEVKIILLKGLRFMLEKSNELLRDLGPGAGRAKEHHDRLGFDRTHLIEVLKQTLRREQLESTRQKGDDKIRHDTFRADLLEDMVTYCSPDELHSILLAHALNDPSERIKLSSWRQFYEVRDGVARLAKDLPENKNPNLEDGVNAVTVAWEAWKKTRGDWMKYMADFKKFVDDPNRDGEHPPGLPPAADTRDALALAILAGFKSCKFEDQNLETKTQALALLSVLMDDPDGKIRLAACHIILGSDLPFHDPNRLKAVKACRDLLENSDNPQFRKEAAALLEALKLPEANQAFFDLVNGMSISDRAQTLSILELLKTNHPSEDDKTKVAELLEQFWTQHIDKITQGTLTIAVDELRADDALLPRLLAVVQDNNVPEQKRLNAAKVWFLADHKSNVGVEDFETALKSLTSLATDSKDAAIKEGAVRLMVASLNANMELTPGRSSPNWFSSITRQEALLKALAEVKHPLALQLITNIAKGSDSNFLKLHARDLLVTLTINDIRNGLAAPANEKIRFVPLVDSRDPRILSLWLNKYSTDEHVKLASMYALLAPESTGVSARDKSSALEEIVKLSLDGAPGVQLQAKRILEHLDKDSTIAAIRSLLVHFANLESVKDRNGNPIVPDKSKLTTCLLVLSDIFKGNLPDANGQLYLQQALEKAKDHFPTDNPIVAELNGLLIKAINTYPSRSGTDWLMNHSDESVALDAVIAAIANPQIEQDPEGKGRALARLAYLAIAGSDAVRNKANDKFKELELKDPEACINALRSTISLLERARQLDRDKIAACTARIAELRRTMENRDVRMRDTAAAASHNPDTSFSSSALREARKLLDDSVKAHGKDSLEAGRAHLLLAKIYFAQARWSHDKKAVDEAHALADSNAKSAEAILRSKLGRDAPELADVNYRLGLIYLSSNQPDKAEPHLRKSLEEYTKAGADRHRTELLWVNAQLALTKISQTKPADARPYQTELLSLARNADSDTVEKIVNYLRRSGNNFENDRAPAKQEEALKLALAVSEANSTTASSLAPSLMIDLAFALANHDKQREAIPYLTRAIRVLERDENKNAKELVCALHIFGDVLDDLGRSAEARKYWDRAEALRKKASEQRR